ncbi:hypothetical protein [Gymnodinialimonas hymeniacidonis]|uniref:hypothetical protein n=1 Tax=Gymnodinialimonas hymeniacidonis TaxID=3126508 RepID=UPI0034C69918
MPDLMDSLTVGGGSLWILAIGLVFKLTGFAVRDELLLRLLVVCGFICDAGYYFFRPDPIVPSVLSNIALLSVNVVLIAAILLERTTWRMTPDDREVFVLFPTLTPGQFRRLRKMMQTEQVGPGSVLTQEGKGVDELMLVFTSEITIEKGGQSFPIAGPAFVGEIAFLTGEVSSATVTLPHGGTVLRVESAALKKRMARSPAFNNAMVALFGHELARKVAYSAPMGRAAP